VTDLMSDIATMFNQLIQQLERGRCRTLNICVEDLFFFIEYNPNYDLEMGLFGRAWRIKVVDLAYWGA